MKNLIGIWPNLSRAYEIASVGKLSIELYFDKEYFSPRLDAELIRDFYKGVSFHRKGEIQVSLHHPYFSDIVNNSHSETMKDILERIDKAKQNKKPDLTLDSISTAILKTAYDRLKFSVTDVQIIIDLAAVIAQMEGVDKIRAEHIAEAIQYRTCTNDESYKTVGLRIPFDI
jgi:hypothetical protein